MGPPPRPTSSKWKGLQVMNNIKKCDWEGSYNLSARGSYPMQYQNLAFPLCDEDCCTHYPLTFLYGMCRQSCPFLYGEYTYKMAETSWSDDRKSKIIKFTFLFYIFALVLNIIVDKWQQCKYLKCLQVCQFNLKIHLPIFSIEDWKYIAVYLSLSSFRIKTNMFEVFVVIFYGLEKWMKAFNFIF